MNEQQFEEYMRAAGAAFLTIFMVIILIWAIALTYISLTEVSEERKGR